MERQQHNQLVQHRFNSASETYDSMSAETLYAAPARISQRVDTIADAQARKTADLGCGTGLVGQMLKGRVGLLHGIDLSENSLRVASGKTIYDELFLDEVEEFLKKNPDSYDLIVLGSVFLYFADLSGVLGLIARALRPGGHVIFTADRHDDPAIDVMRSPRGELMVIHSADYVRRCVEGAGLQISHFENFVERLSWTSRDPVPALLVHARSPG